MDNAACSPDIPAVSHDGHSAYSSENVMIHLTINDSMSSVVLHRKLNKLIRVPVVSLHELRKLDE